MENMEKSNKALLSFYIITSFLILILSVVFVIKNKQEKAEVNISVPPVDCVSKECTVSPTQKVGIHGELVPLYQDADFPSLDTALKAVKNQEGAKLLLLAGDKPYNSKHAVIASSNVDKELVIFEKSIHLRGEEVNDVGLMPKIDFIQKLKVTDPNGKEVELLQRNTGIYGRSALGFYNNKNSSLENLLFDQRINMFLDQTDSYYNNIDNILAAVKAVNSNLNIKNCYFQSNSNTDVAERLMPTDMSQVRRNRVTAALYINSSGEISQTGILGHWAGGFLAKDNSFLTVKNNQIAGNWFTIAGRNSDLKVFNNSIYSQDGRRYMGSPAGNWQGLKAQYPEWIGPLPITDFPVYGVWLEGGSLTMEFNTMGEQVNLVDLNNVADAKVNSNVFVFGASGGPAVKTTNSSVVSSNNIELPTKSEMHANLDLYACLNQGFGGFDSGLSGGMMPICQTLPKAGSVVYQNQAGFTFGPQASNWNNWRFLRSQKGCSSIVQTYFPSFMCKSGLVCEQNACKTIGEEAPAIPSIPPLPASGSRSRSD
jgi:hypothetical protein